MSCSSTRVALLAVDLSLSQSFLLCFSEPLLLDSLCPLWRCFSQLSKYPYFHQTGSCKLLSSLAKFFLFMFHSHKFLGILTIFSSLSNRFLSCCFLYSSVRYRMPVIWRINKFTPVVLAPWLQFILKPDWRTFFDRGITKMFKFGSYKLCRFSRDFLGEYFFEPLI